MAYHAPHITLTLSMYNHSRTNRIISLDVHSKTLAYAVFDGLSQLLDFSVSGSKHSGFQAGRVEKLVRKFQPEVIVLQRVPAGSTRDTQAVRTAIKSIRAKAKHLCIPVVFIEKRLIDETFRRESKLTKYKVALVLAACFSTLTWYVPCKRKPWMPEDRRMQYFDAAAAGVAYFAIEKGAEAIKQFLFKAESCSLNLLGGA